MNDADIEQVLKSAGPREKPPVEIERAVHDSLRAEWRALVAERLRHRRRRMSFAIAAGILAAAVGVWVAAPRMTGPAEVVATLALATGEVRVRSGWFGGWHAVAGGQSLASGQTLQTGSAGRGVLTLPGGVSARMDHDTRVLLAGRRPGRPGARGALCRCRTRPLARRAARRGHAGGFPAARGHAVRSPPAGIRRAPARARGPRRVAGKERRVERSAAGEQLTIVE